jgi:hypothetical protein
MTGDTALRGAPLGRGEVATIDHPRLQPRPDQSPGGERSELAKKMVMIDAVERGSQISVKRPHALAGLTS